MNKYIYVTAGNALTNIIDHLPKLLHVIGMQLDGNRQAAVAVDAGSTNASRSYTMPLGPMETGRPQSNRLRDRQALSAGEPEGWGTGMSARHGATLTMATKMN